MGFIVSKYCGNIVKYCSIPIRSLIRSDDSAIVWNTIPHSVSQQIEGATIRKELMNGIKTTTNELIRINNS
jgi:hypothetical protein